MQTQRPSLLEAITKSAVVHTVSYFLLGFISFALLDYSARFSDPVLAQYFRPTSDRLVAAGPLFQPIRGILLGALLFLLRAPFFHRKRGDKEAMKGTQIPQLVITRTQTTMAWTDDKGKVQTGVAMTYKDINALKRGNVNVVTPKQLKQ